LYVKGWGWGCRCETCDRPSHANDLGCDRVYKQRGTGGMSSLLFTFNNKQPLTRNSTAEERIAALLNGVSDVTVVGNGPISEVDRKAIAASKFVIRFNDCNFLRDGEKTSLRVMRHPSQPPKVHINAPIWHVSPRYSAMWDNSITTLNYEAQMGARNDASENARIFPNCNCGPSCLEKSATAGASTGAVALSVLEGIPQVKRINVFGMNWRGSSYLHVDFMNTSLVKGCLSKGHFHQTASSAYGSEQPASVILMIIIGSVVGGFLLLYGFTELVWRGRASGACDACGPVVHLEDDVLMKGDESSEEEEDEEDDEEEALAPLKASTDVVVAVQRMRRLVAERDDM